MSCCIGEFHMVHYHTMLRKYSYHRMLMFLLGKHECKELIRKYIFTDMNSVMTEHDYNESLKA